ncbi:MAG: peptide ABC transporter substrate-binding protein [Treponema sp.]|nr:peptide ABC transporter substrate-binding protein [Treponema sp.]
MMFNLKKYLLLPLFTILVFSHFSFAQTAEDFGVLDETLEDSTQNIVDAYLQGNFILLEAERVHELNPQVTSYAADSQLLSGLYEGLFEYNPKNLEPQFAIASNYRISRDKKRWTFTINPKAYFSNGEKITAQNVRDSWLQLLATPNAPYSSLLDVIEGAYEYRSGLCTEDKVAIYVNAPDSLTLHLVEPANYLPKVLCHTAFSVMHRNPTVYSGAFFLDDYDEGSYVLKKNPYYWDAANTHLEKITVIQSNDMEENAFYFNTGMADWVNANINTDKILDRKAMQFSAEFATSYLFFKDSSRKPSYVEAGYASIWDYVEFREALFEAIPWDALRAGSYTPATTLVYPLAGYPVVEGYSYTDVAEAKKLMEAAREKYGIGKDEIIPLVLQLSPNTFSDEKLTAFSQALAEIGVELQIQTIDTPYYLSSIKYSDADLFCYVWIGDFADPLAFLELFKSNSSLNDSGWANLQFDELLKKAATVGVDERIKLLAEAEQILLDSCEVIPIYHPVAFNLINLEEVGGWYLNAFDIHPLKYLYKKNYIKKRENVVIK